LRVLILFLILIRAVYTSSSTSSFSVWHELSVPALPSESPAPLDPLEKKLMPVLSKVVEVLGEKNPSTAPAFPKIQVEVEVEVVVAVEVAADGVVEVDSVVMEGAVRPAESPNLSACAVRLATSSWISFSRGL
jgi:hypothetical protein